MIALITCLWLSITPTTAFAEEDGILLVSYQDLMTMTEPRREVYLQTVADALRVFEQRQEAEMLAALEPDARFRPMVAKFWAPFLPAPAFAAAGEETTMGRNGRPIRVIRALDASVPVPNEVTGATNAPVPAAVTGATNAPVPPTTKGAANSPEPRTRGISIGEKALNPDGSYKQDPDTSPKAPPARVTPAQAPPPKAPDSPSPAPRAETKPAEAKPVVSPKAPSSAPSKFPLAPAWSKASPSTDKPKQTAEAAATATDKRSAGPVAPKSPDAGSRCTRVKNRRAAREAWRTKHKECFIAGTISEYPNPGQPGQCKPVSAGCGVGNSFDEKGEALKKLNFKITRCQNTLYCLEDGKPVCVPGTKDAFALCAVARAKNKQIQFGSACVKGPKGHASYSEFVRRMNRICKLEKNGLFCTDCEQLKAAVDEAAKKAGVAVAAGPSTEGTPAAPETPAQKPGAVAK